MKSLFFVSICINVKFFDCSFFSAYFVLRTTLIDCCVCFVVEWMSFTHDVMTSMLSRGIATIGRNNLACGTLVVLGDAMDARSQTQVETEEGS